MEWIKTSEQKPKEFIVLIFLVSENDSNTSEIWSHWGGAQPYIGVYHENNFVNDEFQSRDCFVTHWMYLPTL